MKLTKRTWQIILYDDKMRSYCTVWAPKIASYFVWITSPCERRIWATGVDEWNHGKSSYRNTKIDPNVTEEMG